MESIIKDWCPECDSINFVNNGDISDLTMPDIEAIKCHKCGHIWTVDPDLMHDGEMDDLFIEDGEPTLS